jgi:hypothetical protein
MSLISSIDTVSRKRLLYGSAAFVFVALICLGVMAKNGWLPRTDPLSGKRTGWFGREVPKNAPSNWNPFAMPPPSPTPQLSKEYIYAGSRLLAAEDANASAVPPEDLAVWRPSTGIWYILGSQQTPPQWGQAGDIPVQGDYDGDGRTDFAVLRPDTYPANSNWWISPSGGGSYYNVPFGLTNDQPVQADYDGDGKTDIAVWRPCITNCYWYILPSSTCTPTCSMTSTQFGNSQDVPVPADFDGDGIADVAVWRNSNQTFYSRNSSNGQVVSVQFGSTGTPVCGDYDGDGKANYALLSGNNWIIMNATLSGTTTTQWQLAGDKPVQNDYDGDGKVDIAVWRNSKNAPWYILQSHDGSTRTEYWGTLGDIPVPAFYRR